MKRLFVIVAVLAVMTACTKNEFSAPKSEKLTFRATTEVEEGGEASATKTYLSTSGTKASVLWSEGDAISVFADAAAANNQMTMTAGAGTKNATFEGSYIKAETGYAAIYPYNEGNAPVYNIDKTVATGYEVVWNGQTQVGVKNTMPLGTPMAAYAAVPSDNSNEVTLKFKNLLPMFKFTTTAAFKSAVISTSESTDYLSAGTIGIAFTVSDNTYTPLIVTKSAFSNTVTLAGKDGAELEAGTYYVAVLPSSKHKGLTITFNSSNVGTIITQSTTSEFSMESTDILDLGSFDLMVFNKLEGEGTEASPYLIKNQTDLRYMALQISKGEGCSAYYKQTADIICDTDYTFTEIGVSGNIFTGTYDGDGHSIRSPHYAGNALFGEVMTATIKNLDIVNPFWVYTEGSTWSAVVKHVVNDQNTSAVTTISNVKVSGTNQLLTTKDLSYYGSIVGLISGGVTITNCTSNMNIEAYTVNSSNSDTGNKKPFAVGGIAGYFGSNNADGSFDVTIDRCRNNGTILSYSERVDNSSGMSVGGILGAYVPSYAVVSSSGTKCNLYITNCVNNGNITGFINCEEVDFYLGGISGYLHTHDGEIVLRNCLNNGTVYNKSYSGSHSNQTYAAGIVNYTTVDGMKVEYCANTGSLVADKCYSIGARDLRGQLKNCYNTNTNLTEIGGGDKTDCNNSATFSEVPTLMNAAIAASSYSASLAQWKAWQSGETTLDINF